MKALTVKQPWAWSIIFGGKDIENRSTNWSYRGRLAIHAGALEDRAGWSDERVTEEWMHATDWQADAIHIRSAVIGIVDLIDVHRDTGCCRPWGDSAPNEGGGRARNNRTHLVLDNVTILDQPIPCLGAQGLWTPPTQVLEVM
ncbi:hypothetical protein [Rhodococcoides kyotonense]|uniref:ASCH domain-containing protein n=1 Tax=Rhodococcoides kyotonense TaxID=398843 RepID=A0A239FRB6_9NOCA|nr:hypothetical protein [Rhodococcus kyotonensis]SNS59487.1 hypothetical protein SAMN05421642_103423 [Rhodococcus kyotonensis]